MDIQELTEQVKSHVGLIVEHGDELVPVIFVVSGEEGSVVGFELDERVKAGWHTLLPALLNQFNATAYVMVIEGWRSIRLEKDSPLIKRLESGEISVSQLPADDKDEIAQVFAVDNGKFLQCWHAKIERTPSGRFITGWESMSEVSGRLLVKEW